MTAHSSRNIYLFTDGSVNPQTKEGFGAILWVHDLNQDLTLLKSDVQTKRFENTSSTKLELETLLWALDSYTLYNQSLIIYTDSQNLTGLLERRTKLEAKTYKSKNNTSINNAKLYKEFYMLHDRLNFEIAKIKGHKRSINKTTIDDIFTLVDKAAREALRNSL